MVIFPLGFISPKQQIFNKEHTHDNENQINGIQRAVQGLGSPDELFEMLRVDICEQVCHYFTESMRTELTGSWDENVMNVIKSQPTTVMAPMSAASPLRGLER